MRNILKFSIHFNKVFKHRGGRWITVYKGKSKINGKVIKTNPLWATIQRSDNPLKLVRVLNFNIDMVNADHHHMTMDGNFERNI